MARDPYQSFQDGNALAGPLLEVFATDMTAAECACAGCGRTDVVATLRVFWHAEDAVARCPGCDAVVFRLVRVRGQVSLDLAGITSLRIPLSTEE
jgi:pyruvate/2-oxoacid:ferredoxin oxidoreductase beta subunit